MRMWFLLCVALAACSAQDSCDNDRLDFAEWKQAHSRVYASDLEEAERFRIWTITRDAVHTHNNNQNPVSSYKMGLNRFSDLTPDEFKNGMLCLTSSSHTNSDFPSTICLQIHNDPQYNRHHHVFERKNMILSSSSLLSSKGGRGGPPEAIDWRALGAVTPVKDQQDCGSCYAFSAIASLESIWKIKHGTLYNLSEQQLVDCSFAEGNYGCGGGLMDTSFNYTKQNGACTAASYPYTATDGKCKETSCTSEVQTTGCANLWTGDISTTEFLLQMVVAFQHPVSVAVDAGTWQNYESGIINDTNCYQQLDHGVAVVGYDKDSWIIKNSWGTSWGEAGYVRLAKGGNICGVAELPSFVTVM